MKLGLSIISVFLLAANASKAEQPHANLRVGDLVNACVSALHEGMSIDTYAEELKRRNRFHLGAENAAKGKKCLEAAYGIEFSFGGGRFNSPELQAKKRAQEAALERDQLEREQVYNSAVIKACFDELERDRFRALTTPVCGSVFKAVGLP